MHRVRASVREARRLRCSSHPALPRCHCESRRVLHAPPVLFKGSGFYVTDNRKSGLVGSASASAGSNGDNGNGDKEIAGVEAASTSEVKSSSKAPDKKSEATATG